MPQPFNNAVMTRDGAMLLSRAQAGEIKIKFTRIGTGNGIYSTEEKTFPVLQEQKELKSLKNSYPLSHIEIYSEHSVRITALITNKDLITGEILINEGYFINEMGLFAKPDGGDDSTEVLYSIAVTSGENGDFMPPYNGYNPAQITQEYFATVSNSSETTINFAGAALSAEQVEAKLKKKADLGMDGKLLPQQVPVMETEPVLLHAGETSATFALDGVKDGSSIKVFSSVPSTSYTNIDIDGNSITVTFEAQEEDIYLKAVVSDALV